MEPLKRIYHIIVLLILLVLGCTIELPYYLLRWIFTGKSFDENPLFADYFIDNFID